MKKLTPNEIKFLTEILQSGREIPFDWKYRLFPTKQKEYELVYAGKMRKEDLLANEDGVFPVPLQVEKSFNGNEYKAFKDGWKNMIVFGDNLQFLKTIYENKDPLIKNKVKGKVNLIYIDPPFGTGDEYDGNRGQKAYSARRKGTDFVEFLRRRLILAKEILADDGSIYMRIDYRFGHYIKILQDEIFDKNNFKNQIVINKSGRPIEKISQFHSGHDFLLFYTKKDNYYFNNYEIQKEERKWQPMHLPGVRWSPIKDKYVELFSKKNLEKRRDKYVSKARIILGKELLPPTGRHWALGQEAIFEREKLESIRLNKNGNPETLEAPAKKVNDIWTDIPGYSRTMNYPTENSEAVLERVIKSSSNEGDIVMDFFGGSGTTMAVAEKLNRKWITCDLGKFSYFTMQKRILQIQNSKNLENPKKEYGKKAKKFITAQLGIYDLERALDLEWQQYQDFVSGLFEVDVRKNKIAGFEFDGKRGDYPVKIFDYRKFKDSVVDKDYLNAMHNIIGKRVSGRVYIIAPINYVNFLTNYHEISGVKYYFLKIPYRIIKEIHKMPFQKLRQPQSKQNVNELDEAVGFHFIRHPEVKSEIRKSKEEIKILIKSFVSCEPQSGKRDDEKKLNNFETLSAVFVDKNYNGKAFEMDVVYFADDLLPKQSKNKAGEDIRKELKKNQKKGLEIPLKKSELGKKIMVIYTDIYGNDFTEILTI